MHGTVPTIFNQHTVRRSPSQHEKEIIRDTENGNMLFLLFSQCHSIAFDCSFIETLYVNNLKRKRRKENRVMKKNVEKCGERGVLLSIFHRETLKLMLST